MRGGRQQRDLANLHGVKIEVKGLTETLRALNRAGADAQDMKDLMHSTGEIIAAAARARVPTDSGALKNSIKAGRGKTKAVVRAGSARRVPYAGVVHYGNPHEPKSTPHPFLLAALQAKQAEALAHIERGLSDLLRKNGLR